MQPERKPITNFYTPPEKIKNDRVLIEGEESFHLAKVLKFNKGEIIPVVDGLGNKYKVVISNISKKCVEGDILTCVRKENEPLVNITLAPALSAGTKMDSVIEKCTEIGVNAFIPILTDKSLVKLEKTNKAQNKTSRWRKVAIAAMKQSLRSYLPKIHEIMEFEQILQKTPEYDLTLIASLEPQSKSVREVFNSQNKYKNILLLVGPEGGFTPSELEKAREYKTVSVSLGPRRLRTETASIILVSQVLTLCGEMS
ncbi:MAG: hypothetical protein RBG1_1C00001G1486 [candidate division Zixibacteria bacterium RBG-1]|nr:MAG: hypothetical protein RBG1_1C00001G1486 [candidate division Zixibacteria bacterium RBG-1]OGC85774.1 MAG: hypothetical protein A2V73_08270 [candidate division Zixibacteria bacterium RBG_19FT_COMBO_42_43]